jgi:hypothetical protein
LAYVQFAQTYYRRNGELSREIDGIRDSLRPLRQLYGLSPAEKFGPKRLKAIRQHMVTVQDLSRSEINKRIRNIEIELVGFRVTLVIPETASLLLALVGLAGANICRRRRLI